MGVLCRAANLLWMAAAAPAHRAFVRALEGPEEAQWRALARVLRANRGTEFGKKHGFDAITSVREFQNRVPVSGYADIEPDILRMAAGARGVLVAGQVRCLMPTSGSASAAKLIPYTAGLQRQFGAAISPWVCGMFRDFPDMVKGRAYWSVSPAMRPEQAGQVKVGFADDTEYLHPLFRPLARATLAVPPDVRHLQDHGEFRRHTLLHLLAAGDLRLISVWHPSFLGLLLEVLAKEWDSLLQELARGSGSGRAGGVVPAPTVSRTRLRELARCSPGYLTEIWPHLQAVSMWTHGGAAGAAGRLAHQLRGIPVIPKGLVATEGIVSVPFAGSHPLAVGSHFLEFAAPAGGVLTAGQLEVGGEYTVILTTAGGLYRYRLGDRVLVDGRVGATPTIRFLEREGGVSDLVGEKLANAFVDGAIQRAIGKEHPGLAMLVPDSESSPPGYVLLLEPDGGAFPAAGRVPAPAVAEAAERELLANPHYAYARRLGQLAPLRVVQAAPGATAAYVKWRCRNGASPGDIKVEVLERDSSVLEALAARGK